jgi:hypothetical protein
VNNEVLMRITYGLANLAKDFEPPPEIQRLAISVDLLALNIIQGEIRRAIFQDTAF